MEFMANSLLALGAAPLMSESKDELEELIHLSAAVYINLGTLNEAFMERAILAAQIANSLNKPLILDPVGAGASTLRSFAAKQLLTFAQIIRGNASEIMALAGAQNTTKGVEANDPVLNAIHSARLLAKQHQKIIIISGPDDFITDGMQEFHLSFGSDLMPLITGMGCTMTAVLSAFVAVNPDWLQASVQAAAYFSLCGQQAHQQAQSPALFKQQFIDNLFNPDWDFFSRCAEV